ncbi:MAG: hypothetical protein ACE5FG_12590 [Myxococcota bacterium]
MSALSRALVLLIPLLALGCASRGRPFNVDAVPLIRPGVTDEARLLELFGEPTGRRVRGTGGSEWTWFHEETTTRDSRMLSKIGRAIASVLRVPFFLPPLDVRYSTSRTHILKVQLDGMGTVLDYSYEVRETPSRKVY